MPPPDAPDAWMFQPTPSLTSGADVTQTVPDESWNYPFSPDVIRTIAGEGDPAAVATALKNRSNASGLDYDTLIRQPNQFEARTGSAWSTNSKLKTSSPKFQFVLQHAAPILTGDQPPLGTWDSYYSPQGQIAMGRKNKDGTPVVPDWAQKAEAAGQHGVNIGGNLFYTTGWSGAGTEPPGDMTPAEQAEWSKTFPTVSYEPGHGMGGAGQPGQAGIPGPAAATVTWMSGAGLYHTNADSGSVQHPQQQVPGQGPPADRGVWYITPEGKLRQSGDPTDDYIPQFQRITALRGQVSKNLGALNAPVGFGQGLIDIGQSVNKLTGGVAGGVVSAATGHGYDPEGSLISNQQERQAYDLLFGGNQNPLAMGGRFAGQVIPVMAATAGTGEALGALGPAGEFLAGEGGGNVLTQGLSRAASGAIQGATAAGLTSATSDQPLSQQLATGAFLGGGLSTVDPLVRQAGRRLMLGGWTPPAPVAGLADRAINDFNMPITAPQLRAAAGSGAAREEYTKLLANSQQAQDIHAAQRAARMQTITRTYGDPSGDISPGAMEDAHQRITGVMGDVAGRTTIADAKTSIGDKLDEITSHADAVLGDDDLKPLQKLVTNIKSAIQPDGTMSGDSWRALTNFKSQLQGAIRAGKSDYPSQIYGVMQDALGANAAPEDVDALNAAKWQYKNWVAVSKAAPKGEANLGDIPASSLESAVNQTFKNQATMGAGALGDVVKIDKNFLNYPVGPRAPKPKDVLGTVSTLAGLGGEGAAIYLHDPSLAAITAGGIAATAVGKKVLRRIAEAKASPEVTRALISPGARFPNPLQTPVPLLPGATLATKNLLTAYPNQ